MDGGQVEAAVAQLRAAVDALLDAPVAGLGEALPEVICAVEVERRRLEAVDQRLLAAASGSGLAARFGRPGLADVLTSLLRIDPREARARVGRAADLGPRQALTGEPLEPLLPVAAAAVADGELSGAQADVVIDCLEKISPAAPAAAWPVAERVLVEAARHEHPRALARTATELLARLDPDGVGPSEERAEQQRRFTLVKRLDGTATPRGVWTAEATALWEAILDSLAAPQPAADGIADPRSAAQRRHDAMAEAAARLLRSDSLPAAGGVPVTVLATTTMAELAAAAAAACGTATDRTDTDGTGTDGTGTDGTGDPPPFRLAELAAAAGLDAEQLRAASSAGLARLGNGAVISARALLAIASEARVVPAILNDAGGVLAYGRGRRLASLGQRLALAARDGGCSFPGCDGPAAWSEVHHVVEWAAGGATDVDNLCLVCRFHHREFAKAGWQVRMRDGVPEWIPPAWLDPHRTPRRNTTHHRAEFDFRQPTTAA